MHWGQFYNQFVPLPIYSFKWWSAGSASFHSGSIWGTKWPLLWCLCSAPPRDHLAVTPRNPHCHIYRFWLPDEESLRGWWMAVLERLFGSLALWSRGANTDTQPGCSHRTQLLEILRITKQQTGSTDSELSDAFSSACMGDHYCRSLYILSKFLFLLHG